MLFCGIVQDISELTETASDQLSAVVKAHAASASPASILLPPLPFTPPFLSLPANATQALQSLLPRWASVRTFEQAMRFQTLDKAQLQAILTAAENICQAAARKTPLVRSETQHHAGAAASPAAADTKDEPEVDLVGNSTLAGISDGMFMDLDERLDSLPAGEHHAEADQKDEALNEAAIGECAAYMAAEWCGVLGGAYASSAAADFGLAGLAAAVVVASCPRYLVSSAVWTWIFGFLSTLLQNTLLGTQTQPCLTCSLHALHCSYRSLAYWVMKRHN